MSESVDVLRTRVEELESEIGELEETLRRPPDDAKKKRRIVMECDVEVSADEGVLEEVVSLLRRHFSALGEVDLIGRTLSWSLKANAQAGVTRVVQITVIPRGLGTRIRFVEELVLVFGNRIAAYTVGLGMLGFGALAAIAGTLAGPALVPLALAAPVVTHQMGKRSYRKVEAARREEAAALMDQLAAVVVELGSATAANE